MFFGNWSFYLISGTQCAAGLSCQFQNEYYSQCLPGGGGVVTSGPTQPPGPLPVLGDGFPGTTFKHGLSFSGMFNDNDYKLYDYLSIWINAPRGVSFILIIQSLIVKPKL